MIPLQIQIKNFLSYGSPIQTIDLEPYHLICLSGKNGHGKTALLDSITWALWGCARKGTTIKSDEALIRLGSNHMLVILDFLVHTTRYRVRREYSITSGKAVSQLDFGIVDPTNQQIRSLTDKTIRATQEKIETVIGLTYESFVNSAFLRQGQANEFSKKSPRERKDILASILGLDHYEHMRKKAAEKVKQINQEHDTLLHIKQRISLVLQEKESTALELTRVTEHIQMLRTQHQKLEQEIVSITAVRQKNSDITARLQSTTALLDTTRATYHDLTQQLKAHHATWRTSKRALRRTDHNYQEERNRSLKHLEQEVSIYKNTEKLYNQTIHDIQQRTHELDAQHKEYIAQKARLEELEARSKQLATTIHTSEKAALQAQQLAQEIPANEAQFERKKTFYHHYNAKGNMLASYARELDEKMHKLQSTHGACPVCEQKLDNLKQAKLLTQLDMQHRHTHYLIRKIRNLVTKLKEQLTAHHTWLEAQKKVYQELTILSAQLPQLTHEYTQVQILLNNLRTTCKVINTDQDELLKQLMHTKHTHYQYLTEHKGCEERYITLLQEETHGDHNLVEQHYTMLMSTLTQLKKTKQSLKDHEHIIKLLRAEEQQLAPLLAPEAEIRTTIQAVQAEHTRYTHEHGTLEHKMQLISKHEQELTDIEHKIIALDRERHQFTLLAHALGKDGIQALLIEETIPEIEQEANQLLARLTDNQAQLSIDSVKDLKNGSTKETLDIKISDPLGIRPYELFSGGEAFRIDFALRIALARLMARRAGASLQTLIIDEGFGSQDEEGLTHIMDAIYKIQDSFSKIIIVSHLPSMKDQFPVHFHIQKTPQGSTLRVTHQG